MRTRFVILQIQASRYRCRACHRSFDHYPEGVSRAQQSAATKAMTVLLWVLQLSLDKVSTFLRALGLGSPRPSHCRWYIKWA